MRTNKPRATLHNLFFKTHLLSGLLVDSSRTERFSVGSGGGSEEVVSSTLADQSGTASAGSFNGSIAFGDSSGTADGDSLRCMGQSCQYLKSMRVILGYY